MSKKILIVGGVAAGASTAARLRRLDEEAQIVMFERGQDISFANCGLPYYVGGVIAKKKRLLVQTPRAMARRFGIDVRVLTEVREIIPSEKRIVAYNVESGASYAENYDYLVLCPGAQPIVPDIPGIDSSNVYTVRNIPDSERIKLHVEESGVNNVVVIGAGFIGLEMAEMIHLKGLKVTVIEASPQILGILDPEMALIAEKYVAQKGINFVKGDLPVELVGDPVNKVVLKSGLEIPTDLVVLGIGVRPEAWLAEEAGLKLGETGGIWVDEHLKTSDPFIYAAGDAIQIKDYVTGQNTLIPLAGPANRQGWLVANNIAGPSPIAYPGSQGTGIIKLMDLVAASTGKNERALQREGIEYLTCHAHPNSHATYYPGSTQMAVKLIFTAPEGKILGAQVVGFDNVDKTIDVLATAIRAKMTVYDLQDLELAYAPPFSSAKTPANLIGYVAGNILDGRVETLDWNDVEAEVEKGALLVDVRTVDEHQKMPVKGAINLPIDDLRDNLDQLGQDREILTFCQVGLRAYVANRMLRQKGFKVKNISGGYKLYPQAKQPDK